MATTAPTSMIVVHAPFARRMKQACDAHPEVPAMNDGRLTWIRQKMLNEDHAVSLQTVMRWYYGAAMPRQKKMISLAKILGVTPSWLSLGREDQSRVDTSSRRINPEGAVNALAGHMQMCGIPVAFPDPDDPKAEDMHFYSIVAGRQYPIYVSPATIGPKGDTIRFQTPIKSDRLVVIVITMPHPKSIEVWHIPSKVTETAGSRDGGMKHFEGKLAGNSISINRSKLVPIEDFSKPFAA